MNVVRIGLIGDYNPEVIAHQAIPRALDLAGMAIGDCQIEASWLATDALEKQGVRGLSAYEGLWCVPASPYKSMAGALGAIRFAREEFVPFLGTCGGFQHTLIEYARNCLGLDKADHVESNANTELPLIAPLSCSLVERQGEIILQEGSRAQRIYGRLRVLEAYHCRYGLNPAFEKLFKDTPLRFTGRDPAGEVRIMELDGHAFFIATLFQPERSALGGQVHPLIYAFVQAIRYSNVA